MSHLLVFVGEEIDASNLRALVGYAANHGFHLVAEGDFASSESGRQEVLPSLSDFLEEWGAALKKVRGNLISPDQAVDNVRRALRDLRAQSFEEFRTLSVMTAWKTFHFQEAGGAFPALVRTMRWLELCFIDWDLVSQGAVSEIKMPSRGRNALMRYGVDDVVILKNLTDAELLAMDGIGTGILDCIRAAVPAP